MGSVNTKVAYTAGFSALAGIIIFVLFGPKGARPRSQKELQVKGLQNMGSTCYVSAVLQSLAACDHFKSFLESCYRRYNPVDTNGRTIINSKSQLFPLVSALHQACLVVNRRDRNGGNQTPQLHILRILSQLNYRLPRGSEQDSFELFGYLMSGLQEEQTKMVRESKGNDYTCLIPHDDSDTLVEVVVEKFHKDFVITSMEKAVSNGSSSSKVSDKPVVDAGGDNDMKASNNCSTPDENKIQRNHVNLEESKIPHLAHRLGYFHSLKRSNQINPFIGSIASKLQCLTCMSQNSWCIEKFHGISLPLPGTRSDRISLGDLISNYLKTVIVHEVECKPCSDANGNTTKSSFSKLTAITKLPKSLCFHIQRSAWGLSGSHKRTDHVVFSEILDMSSILRFQDVVKSTLKSVSHLDGKTNGVNSSSSVVNSFPLRFYKSQYRLCSVISHCGAPESGHFITFRRGPVDKDVWFLTSDEDVLEVPLMAVFNSKAYMLFYELIEPNGALSYC